MAGGWQGCSEAQAAAKSGRGLPQSKTLRVFGGMEGEAPFCGGAFFPLQAVLAAIGRTDSNSAAVKRSICDSRTVTTSTVSLTALKTSRV